MADLRIAGQEIDKQLSIIQQERETRTNQPVRPGIWYDQNKALGQVGVGLPARIS